ncbi:alpha/beta hydrolase [Endozoicomonas sp. OPT23]|uniref:patatin-like phospholipase family protein n=1 Tax=Endozoicomonas sp. OPT23 TaxID=2072845 RepID=UPI00129BC8EE|nr:patatin-like phospholipase family protein [Endozoicomonas sp. OPT23]MRI34565.1 alpha/beta hydrolase [Endozoicomonas sp. OPT23]
MSNRVALVLGSGGARGYAHVGVIRELEARGYEIVAVSGASMGALIGGLWATGKLEEYCNWAENIDYLEMIRLMDISLSKPGVIKGEKLFSRIREIMGSHRIEELAVPYTAVATSLSTRKEVWFQRGDLVTAIRASCAIPSLFNPVEMQGQLLVDGGVLNPLPMAPAGSAMADMVVAVDLLGEAKPDLHKSLSKEDESESVLEGWFRKLSGNKKEKQPEAALLDSLNLMDVSNQAMEVMQESLSRYKMAGYLPDVHISVPRNICQFYEFHRFQEIAETGRQLAVKALDQWEAEKTDQPHALLEADSV